MRYLASRSPFRAKATVYETLSSMRCFGEYLVREGLWRQNPLRWMKGPKVRPYNHLPRRIESAHMEALWRTAAAMHGDYSRRLWVAVLALLYGTGLRRGELEWLDVEAFDRTHATLKIDGRKSGRERCVPVADLIYRCLEGYLPARQNLLERTGRLALSALLVMWIPAKPGQRSGRCRATKLVASARVATTHSTLSAWVGLLFLNSIAQAAPGGCGSFACLVVLKWARWCQMQRAPRGFSY